MVLLINMKFQIVAPFILLSLSLYSQTKSICGSVDSRTPSKDPAVGRLITHLQGRDACTGTLISKSCAITAGHCLAYQVMEFNTPLSKKGWLVHSVAEDVYRRAQVFGRDELMPGRDWLVFSLEANEVTGKFPGEVQGFYPISYDRPILSTVKVTGHGMDNDSELTYAQQVAEGELLAINEGETLLEHRVDTYGGNSGSAIIDILSNSIIGIHTHGECVDSDSFPHSSNMGTMIYQNKELISAIEKCLETESK